jgi:nickel superoxide dismutase
MEGLAAAMRSAIRNAASILVIGGILLPSLAFAHCQVPCGIYDDAARIATLREDALTIEKAMTEMAKLAGKSDAQSMQQMVRWVTTKETHASDIIAIVSEYFLTQKLKPVEPGTAGYDAYLENLGDHHRVMVAAMKAKQNADAKFVADLRVAIDGLAKHYESMPAGDKK